jgi:Protein of unknown function (DUF2637)
VKRVAGAAVLVVAAIAATVSYMHIERLAVQLGQPELAAWLMPLSVDGAVLAASAALLHSAREAIPAPRMARPMLALGVLATLAANADFGATHGAAGIVLSAWPAVAFIGSAEVTFGMVRKVVRAADVLAADTDTEAVIVSDAEADAETDPVPDIHPGAERTRGRTSKPAKPSAKAAAIVRRQPDIKGAELGRKLGVSERQGRRLLAQVASG